MTTITKTEWQEITLDERIDNTAAFSELVVRDGFGGQIFVVNAGVVTLLALRDAFDTLATMAMQDGAAAASLVDGDWEAGQP